MAGFLIGLNEGSRSSNVKCEITVSEIVAYYELQIVELNTLHNLMLTDAVRRTGERILEAIQEDINAIQLYIDMLEAELAACPGHRFDNDTSRNPEGERKDLWFLVVFAIIKKW